MTDEEYLEKSKERLAKILKQKLSTSFIGAIAEIEKRYPNVKTSEGWEDLRNAILTNGNSQIRAVEKESEQYTVRWDRYQYEFKFTK